MLHAATIFISACLLFLVQLIIGKRILPWFGGAPAVWTTCMLFFQVLLLGGYAYAHLLSARFDNRAQARIHSGLLLLSAAFVLFFWWKWGAPMLPGDAWKPASPESPVWQITKLLAVSVGVPFFLLASTSPLLQRWYSLLGSQSETYRLYALSNAGSLLGLISYPFVVEPWIGLPAQAAGWGILYLLFVGACIACAYFVPSGSRQLVGETHVEPKSGRGQVLLWLLLPAATAAMLLAVTNNLCQEVAVVPFLWVLPLTLYLLSFIIAFDSPRWYSRRWFLLGLSVCTVVVLITALQGIQLGVVTHIISYGVFLLLFCTTCHGELVALKPRASRLTLFYLMISLGGAVGGIGIALIAPAVFNGFWEFHVVLLVGWLLLAWIMIRERQSAFYKGDPLHFLLLASILTYAALRMLWLLGLLPKTVFIAQHLTWVTLGITAAVTLGLATSLWKTRLLQSKYWPRILVGAIIFLVECFMLNRMRGQSPTTVRVDRNFYGVTRVEGRHLDTSGENHPMLQLAHGQITHGIQFLAPPLRQQPVGYYSTNSGIGRAISLHRKLVSLNAPMKIGVLGLGVGTLASYGQSGDRVRFYEINPAVSRYSEGENALFSYLKDSPAKVEVVLGDARISLEAELRRGATNQFDVVAMDAFSSDSVPVHLLTTEAFRLYQKHLRDENSIIAINISNRFLDFRDLIVSMAREVGMNAIFVDCSGDWPDRTPSRWCLMARGSILSNEAFSTIAMPHELKKEILWTDDFSNLFDLLKR